MRGGVVSAESLPICNCGWKHWGCSASKDRAKLETSGCNGSERFANWHKKKRDQYRDQMMQVMEDDAASFGRDIGPRSFLRSCKSLTAVSNAAPS